MNSAPDRQGSSLPPRLTRGDLFVTFLMIGLSGFGGVLPFARRTLVERRRWLSADAFNDTLALCQSLPGPNIVNLSAAVGGQFGGPAGAVAAVTGLVGAPVAIVIVLGALYERFGSIGRTPAVIAALGAAAAGLVAATAMKMATPLLNRRPLSAAAVIGLAFVGGGLLRIPLPWVLLVLAPGGAIASWLDRGGARAR